MGKLGQIQILTNIDEYNNPIPPIIDGANNLDKQPIGYKPSLQQLQHVLIQNRR